MGSLSNLLYLAASQTNYPEKNNANNLDSFTAYGSGNYTKYARDINNIGLSGCQGQPWCAIYQAWLEVQNNGKAKMLELFGPSFPSCFSIKAYAQSKGRWIPKTGTPKPGDRVIFSQSHIGLVTKVTGSYSNGTISTNEGNTSNGSGVDRDGGRVCNKSYSRNYSKILGYVDCGYTAAAPSQTIYSVASASAGVKIVGTSSLNYRDAPKGKLLGSYSRGTVLKLTNKQRASDGKWWYKTTSGYWISGSYIEGWIKESNGKWWYCMEGWTYPRSSWKKIEGPWYFFDASGYMVSNGWVLWKNEWYFLKESGTMAASEWLKWKNKDYYLTASGAMAKGAYVKSATQNLYYWLSAGNKGNGDTDDAGVWEPQWNTSNPNLSKYKVVK